MKFPFADLILPSLTALVGVVLLIDWCTTAPPISTTVRLPGQDGGPLAATAQRDSPPTLPGAASRGPGIPAEIPGSWPGFRGPNRDGVSRDSQPLGREWPPAGPPRLWTVTLGEGYAGAAIGGGCVYVMDYDEQIRADTLRCLSLQDGREIWRNGYPVFITRNHGLSRTVPALAEDCVITIGPRCHLACWNAENGACRWLIDLEQQYGATVPRWYTGQCPLIDEGRVIVAPGGSALLLAVDYRTGEVVWETPNALQWNMTHSSIMPIMNGIQKQFVYCGSGGVVGVAADDGALLWSSDAWPEQFATAPSPVPLPGDRLLLSSGYGGKTGSLILEILERGGAFSARPVVTLTPRQFNSEQHTPILYEGHLYAVRKQGGGSLVCLALDGKERWNSGSDKFGHGPYLIVDGLILVLDNDGRLTAAEANPDSYRRLATAEIFVEGRDAWGPMAIVAGRLVLRDLTRMTCLDLTVAPANRGLTAKSPPL